MGLDCLMHIPKIHLWSYSQQLYFTFAESLFFILCKDSLSLYISALKKNGTSDLWKFFTLW
jgi:hypothetical protein